MFAQREREKRHPKIYIYSEPVQDQTARLICSSFNPCSAPSPRFPFSPSIDFLHGPSPWRLQPGPLSPLLRPEPCLLWDRVHLTALDKDEPGGVYRAPIHTHARTVINFSAGPFCLWDTVSQGPTQTTNYGLIKAMNVSQTNATVLLHRLALIQQEIRLLTLPHHIQLISLCC